MGLGKKWWPGVGQFVDDQSPTISSSLNLFAAIISLINSYFETVKKGS